MSILVVEDDPVLAEGVTRTIGQMGRSSTVARDGLQAQMLLGGNETFDLVVLDIGIGGIDGLTLLRELRRRDRRLPVMLMTARDTIEDRIHGLDLGADDYLVKPVVLSELAARIRALLRRSTLETASELEHGALRMDTATKRLWMAGQEAEITAREWQVLEYLLRRPERVISKEQLRQAIFGDDQPGYNAVEVYISRLRTKFESGGFNVRTVRGFGYMLEESRRG